jgi:hypothetical protein
MPLIASVDGGGTPALSNAWAAGAENKVQGGGYMSWRWIKYREVDIRTWRWI